jgi:hypothetical protein
MALKVDYTSDGDGFTDYVLPKEGARPARLMSIVDVGIQIQNPYQGKVKKPCQQVILGFDLVDDFDDDGNCVRLTTGYFPLNVTTDWKTKTLHEKSKLYAIVKALDPTGSKFNDDFSNLINEPCIINVKLVTRDDKTYANFDGAGPVPDIAGFEVGEASGDPYIFDMDNPTLESWTALQERLKIKVREAVNYPDSAVRAVDETFMANEAEDAPADLPYDE